VYGATGGEPGLLAALARPGRPSVHLLAPGTAAATQFVVAWEGPPSGRGARPLRIELVRLHGDVVRVAWSTADVFPDGLTALGWNLRGSALRVRYEVHYPGWSPGCDGQTEAEDVYRLTPGGSGFVRSERREYRAWHRELRAVVARLFEALAAGGGPALSELVPDAELRRRLPTGLEAEPACDAWEGTTPSTVSVAARTERVPWALTFRRAGGRWRLASAAPVSP
jgi:hypothetical protein